MIIDLRNPETLKNLDKIIEYINSETIKPTKIISRINQIELSKKLWKMYGCSVHYCL
jgi:hypothetical protein